MRNLQVTIWIMLWIYGASFLPAIKSFVFGGGVAAATAALPALPTLTAESFAGFTPAVWGVVALKALNGILIPMTFKYADNILYTYATSPASNRLSEPARGLR